MFPSLTEEYISSCLLNAGQFIYDEQPFDEFKDRKRQAAVLIPMANVENEWHILYTRRTDHLEHHKGQVSFPGGATDLSDISPEMTALREAEEEIGIRPGDVRVLGKLGEYLTVTNFLVTSVVGVIPWPYCFKVHTLEVARVFTIPLGWLADRNNYQDFVRAETGRSVIAYYPYDGELLWGATARITVSFLKSLKLLSPQD